MNETPDRFQKDHRFQEEMAGEPDPKSADYIDYQHWVTSYFSQFKRWIPDLQRSDWKVLGDKFNQVSVRNLELYRAREITPFRYSRLLLILHFFTAYLGRANQVDMEEFSYMFVLMTELSLTPEAIEQWNSLSRVPQSTSNIGLPSRLKRWFSRVPPASELAAAQLTKPGMNDVPILLFRALLRFRRIDVAKDVLDFVYFGYREKRQEIIENSWSEEQWEWNLLHVVPYLIMRHVLPAHDPERMPLPFLSPDMLQAYRTEERMIRETFAHANVAWISMNDPNYLQNKRNAVESVKARNGRVEARKVLEDMYRTRLMLPTYLYRELRDSL